MQVGHFNKAMSKGPHTTSWIWNLHDQAHDFDSLLQDHSNTRSVATRKILSSTLAHLSVILLWLSGMHFHGSYYSNYSSWLRDPKYRSAGCHLVWSTLIGQDILNDTLSQDVTTIRITSGLFHLWMSQGIASCTNLKPCALTCLIATVATLLGSYIEMHNNSILERSLYMHQVTILLGMASISIAGHQIHIAVPTMSLLDSGITYNQLASIPTSIDLMNTILVYQDDLIRSIIPTFGIGTGIDLTLISGNQTCQLGSIADLLNPNTASIFLGTIAFHHLMVGITLILASLCSVIFIRSTIAIHTIELIQHSFSGWHVELAVNLRLTATISIIFAHHVYTIPAYPFISSSYTTMTCLFSHHIWIGGFLILGAAAHRSIQIIRNEGLYITANQLIYNQADIILGHLIWLTIALGLHSFGLYIHNDALESLRRQEDLFSDNGIQLKPLLYSQLYPVMDTEMLDDKLITSTQELGTSDFMIHHIHAFTIHVSVLIMLKGILYNRSSRQISDKLELGFRYPCDGPGRGGTCQISPYDHIYLSVFWMYNSLDLVLFHYFWKMESDVWGTVSYYKDVISHISSGDFSNHAITINGWLRNFLWAESSQVIQSYATSLSGYSLIFIGSHLIWAFSLMFLFSGRGYWQELIESILWSHHKLKIMPHTQPRALSISQGRTLGLTHYMFGGIFTTWSFFHARILALTS